MQAAVRALRLHNRVCVLHGFRANLGSLKLPLFSLAGRDLQSDVEHAWPMSPSVYEGRWDDLGMALFSLMMGFISGSWLAAEGVPPETLCSNALSGFYMLLMNVKRAWEASGINYSNVLLCPTTVRCLLFLSGHMVERCLNQTSEMAPFRPQNTTEAAAEQHFSRVKSRAANGVMSLKSFIFATQREHLQQMHGARPTSQTQPDPFWDGLTDKRAKEIGDQALQSVCILEAVSSVNRTPEQVKKEFTKWYFEIGHMLIFQSSQETAPGDDAEEWCDSEDECLEDMSPEVDSLAQLQDLQLQADLKNELSDAVDTGGNERQMATDKLVAERPLQDSGEITWPAPKRRKSCQPTLAEMLKSAGWVLLISCNSVLLNKVLV